MSDNDRLVMMLLAMIGIPMLLPRVRDQVISWSIGHQVLVPAQDALLAIPGTGAGVDVRRVVVVVLAIALVALATRRATGRGGRSEQR